MQQIEQQYIGYKNKKDKSVRIIGTIAVRALLEEVFTAPKPGLVDPVSSGAHKDMDINIFIISARAIAPYFFEMAKIGYHWDKELPELFRAIRPLGINAEKAMFNATKGVNTHKGLIFLIGILTASAGYCLRHYHGCCPNQLFAASQMMVHSELTKELIMINSSIPKTKGEVLYQMYGHKGIRGEVLSGFSSVHNISLPCMQDGMEKGYDWNQVKVQTLIELMAQIEDTNVLARHDYKTLQYVQMTAGYVIDMGGAYTSKGFKYINFLDQVFIEKNISSGGCADLLAVTIMVYHLSLIDL